MKNLLVFLTIALILFIYFLFVSIYLFIGKENKFTNFFNRRTIKKYTNIKVLSKFYVMQDSFCILLTIYMLSNIIFNNYAGNNYIIAFLASLGWCFMIICFILEIKFKKKKN